MMKLGHLVPVDFDTLDKQLVTIRNRDTMKQESMELIWLLII